MTSKIQWTDEVWNPVRGCTRVSEGCRNCYAERLAASPRLSGPGKAYEGLATHTTNGPRWTGKVQLVEDALTKPLHWKGPRKVFVNSMSDLFHEDVPYSFIDRVFAVMALAPQHQFQILTKRPAVMMKYFAIVTGTDRIGDAVRTLNRDGLNPDKRCHPAAALHQWPLPNVWLGVSVEDQATANERIPNLLVTPATVRFLSCEPLLGSVDLESLDINDWKPFDCLGIAIGDTENKIDWVITGGESGPNARPVHPDWLRSLRDQCARAAVPFFFKQWGEYRPLETDAEWDNTDWHRPGYNIR
jgi:protein gp37